MSCLLPSDKSLAQALRETGSHHPHLKFSLKGTSFLAHSVLRSWLRWITLLKEAISSTRSSQKGSTLPLTSRPSDPFMLPYNLLRATRSSITHSWPLLSHLSLSFEILESNLLVALLPSHTDGINDESQGEEEMEDSESALLCIRCHSIQLAPKGGKAGVMPWEGSEQVELLSSTSFIPTREVGGLLRQPFPFGLPFDSIFTLSLHIALESTGGQRGDDVTVMQVQLVSDSLRCSIRRDYVERIAAALRLCRGFASEFQTRIKGDSVQLQQFENDRGHQDDIETRGNPRTALIGLKAHVHLKDDIKVTLQGSEPEEDLSYSLEISGVQYGISSMRHRHSMTFTIATCNLFRQQQRYLLIPLQGYQIIGIYILPIIRICASPDSTSETSTAFFLNWSSAGTVSLDVRGTDSIKSALAPTTITLVLQDLQALREFFVESRVSSFPPPVSPQHVRVLLHSFFKLLIF